MNTFLQVYLQFNLLLLIAAILWGVINAVARLYKNALPFKERLNSARYFLCAIILVAVFIPALQLYFESVLIIDKVAPLVSVSQLNQFVESAETLLVDSNVNNETVFSSIGIVEFLFFGFVFQLARFSKALSKLNRLIQKASLWRKIAEIQVLFSDQSSVPFSTNVFFKKYIVLPYSLLESQDNLKITLRHEVQHHRNNDLSWVVVLEIVKLFCYWNPAAYFWKNQIVSLQEYACDEALLKTKQTTQSQYGKCLLDIATYQDRTTLVACSNMVPNLSYFQKKNSQLKRRLTMLNAISSTRKSTIKSSIQGVLLSVAIVTASTFVYAQNEGDDGITINGIFISEESFSTPDYVEGIENQTYSDDLRNIFSSAKDRVYSELPQKQDETLVEYSERVGREYVRAQQLIAGLEAYAAGYEVAYDDMEKQKLALEEYAQGYETAYDTIEKEKIGLEQYAADYEEAYDNLEQENLALEERIAELEQLMQ